MPLRSFGLFVVVTALVLSGMHGSEALSAESPASHKKKEVTPDTYKLWRSIEHAALSADGKWAAYTLESPEGASELIVRATHGLAEFHAPRGMRRLAVTFEEALAEAQARANGSTPLEFTPDSRFVVFSIAASGTPPPTSTRTTAEGNPASAARWQPGLGILQLPKGELIRIATVSDFALAGKFLAYRRAATADENATANGRTLVLRELPRDEELEIPAVSEFAFDGTGEYLAYTVAGMDPAGNGVYVRRLSDGRITPLLAGAGEYRSLTFAPSGKQLAFLSKRAEAGRAPSGYNLYYAASLWQPAEAVVKAATVQTGLRIAAERGVQFTELGTALRFELEPERPTRARQAPQAMAELWHWKARIAQSNPPTLDAHRWEPHYLGVYHLAERHWTQVDRELRYPVSDARLTADGRHAIIFDRTPYDAQASWGEGIVDLYVADSVTGRSTLFRRALRTGEDFLTPGPVRLSPGGHYMAYFDDRRWYSYDFETGKTVDLTKGLLPGDRFEARLPASIKPPRSIGLAGWTENDRRVLIYSSGGIWSVDPAGVAEPHDLTAGFAPQQDVVFRVWPHGEARAEDTFTHEIVLPKPLLLTGYDRRTGDFGLWRIPQEGATPQPVLVGKKKVSLLAKAKHAEQYLLTQETAREFPDLWTGSRLQHVHRISNANPQQREYRWANAQLVQYTSKSGLPMEGVLYTPEDFDPARQYPMIVDVYGIPTGTHHYYWAPSAPGPRIDQARYISRGYLIFRPSIDSVSPYPGEAAVAGVVPAIRAVLDRGFVDPRRIGLIGYSQGGFYVNYLTTRTPLFRCAVEGAGVSDMLSRYGTDPAIVETRQDNLGYSPWENIGVYLANSSVIAADRVQTPLLILHNKQDYAVPHLQGQEFFTALRRNGKRVYMLNYTEEDHYGLRRGNDARDWSDRMEQFFDTFLKDAPQPAWMGQGSSAPDDVTRMTTETPISSTRP